MLGHGAGGEMSRRLLERLGIKVSGDTVLRQLKGRPIRSPAGQPLRVGGVDDWAWSKGSSYGTILVDLEQRMVVDVLADRSQASVARWLANHPGIEFVCRDRHGLYAEAARVGAPQARQVADRFHLIQNLRSRFEHYLGGRHHRPINAADPKLSGADRENLDRAARERARGEQFAHVQELHGKGWSAMDISRRLGITRQRIDKWVRCEAMPERAPVDPKTTSPARFEAELQRLVRRGVTKIRWLFDELKKLGYTGSFGHLARYMAHVRSLARARERPIVEPRPVRLLPRDPVSGARMSPLAAAVICMKPRPMLTERQLAMLEVLKDEVVGFTAMRKLAMRFRGLLRGRDVGKLEAWIVDAQRCGIPAIIHFARTLTHDIDAVRNAVAEPWSNGPTEGHINKLKMLRRVSFGRAGVQLLRARLTACPA